VTGVQPGGRADDDSARSDDEFWTAASRPALDAVWENTDDDTFEELMEPDPTSAD
jgi:hypothetical protein